MGGLAEHNCEVMLENTLKVSCMKIGVEEEPEIQAAVRVLLGGLGEDVNRKGIKKTPLRVAKALRYATRGYKQNVNDIVEGALFPEAGLEDDKVGEAGGTGGIVIVRDLNLYSSCESCLLPFEVKCHVGYVPSRQRVVGLSKLSRVADVFAKRLQDPQRMADEICLALQCSIEPAGVAVILECLHIDFPTLESTIVGPSQEVWKKAVVSSGSGVFENKEAGNDMWTEFFGLLKMKSLADRIQKSMCTGHWCPSQAPSISVIPPDMVSAVATILRTLGEDQLRKELIGTPARFLNWLLNFQARDFKMKLDGFASKIWEPRKSDGDVKGNMKIHSELNLPLRSQCEHHLLPFYGVVHVGYFSAAGMNPIGKTILQSVVHFYGSKLQVQERLTKQIAETMAPLLGGDIIVVAEASHTCMLSRGVEKFGSSTATIAVLGRFSTDPKARALFMESLPFTEL
ncbi:GTP cyclohydrolase 1-like [Chenopodium quinoa]|uniref:GTP cyclohydrolase 1-like n=1 Tax=Chenopodium quinoa TaxID=63459 RepID=UPI000B781875|nr:GTP cyclohydrolase 1-like [Chenopodium quinoa]